MKKKIIYILFILTTVLISCEKEITVDLPDAEDKIVIEGSIENGMFPIVIISRNMSYFDKVDTNTYENLLVTDATVVVTDGIITDTLMFIYPIYIGFGIIGEIGKSYDLTVIADGKTMTATTRIPNPVPIDSIKFQKTISPEYSAQYNDSLGFIWMYAKDPDTLGNCYRFFTMTNGPSRHEQLFVHPSTSVTDDQYFNGRNVEFSFENGDNPYLDDVEPNESDTGYVKPPSYYFRLGDTVIVKLSSIDPIHYNFWYTIEQQVGTDGNPFASPTTIQSNIKGGGLGVWGGYGAFIDTVILTPALLME
ncbi:MAG: hypothetical protein A2W91_20590 [Bacteroidetes bacterium GWF2_38_335]|nr:MAG: hypothetical protein A2W91_20590 [Bacteroidetes bacterium GWF2_38_335]OFY79449.1 MAG: hypothetical protein A2281_13495 [Bacteroidetes bacterium RIFOXYA12_FULL_38_20]HBS86618.1 hypothetical protein [Bacteroidales bacterium]